jgi:hypothetical protein
LRTKSARIAHLGSSKEYSPLGPTNSTQFDFLTVLTLTNWQVRDKTFLASRKNTASKFVSREARKIAQYRRERCSIVVVVVEI